MTIIVVVDVTRKKYIQMKTLNLRYSMNIGDFRIKKVLTCSKKILTDIYI